MRVVVDLHEVFHALVIAAGVTFYVAIARVIVAGLWSADRRDAPRLRGFP